MLARADGCTYDAGVLGSVSRSRPIFCRAVPNPNQRCDSHLPPLLYGLSATPFALVQADKSEADMKERVRHVEEALRRAKAVAQGAPPRIQSSYAVPQPADTARLWVAQHSM